MDKRFELYKIAHKQFLSDEPDEYSAICTNVQVVGHTEYPPWLNAEVRVQDCSRPIFIDFDISVYEILLDARLQKLDNMISSLTKFREELCEGYDIYVEATETHLERKKKEEAKED